MSGRLHSAGPQSRRNPGAAAGEIPADHRRLMRLLARLPWLVLLLSLTLQAAPAPEQQAVASAHPIATAAGHRILDQGGNAFDAAIAVAATLAVVEPYGSGIGGGRFFLLRQPGEVGVDYRFIDARETAPQAAHRDMYLD